VPSLAGRIAEIGRSFEGTLGMRPPKPLANTPVRVKAAGKAFETQSDAAGLYAFYNLPEGNYEFAAGLPPGTTLSSYIGSDGPPPSVRLPAGSCQESDIEVFPSGSIEGRVLDASNKPLPYASVYIVPADEKVLPKRSQLYRESQDKERFFKFVHIPPGQYLILVNPDDVQDPDFPYQRTFHPSAHERESAEIITIVGGEQIAGADIRLEQEFKPRHLKVRVTWQDGRLIRDIIFVEAKPTENAAAAAQVTQPDLEKSVVDLLIVAHEPYDIEAKLICRYSDEHGSGPGATLQSNQIYFGPGDGRKEISLTIPAKACPEIEGKILQTEHWP